MEVHGSPALLSFPHCELLRVEIAQSFIKPVLHTYPVSGTVLPQGAEHPKPLHSGGLLSLCPQSPASGHPPGHWEQSGDAR